MMFLLFFFLILCKFTHAIIKVTLSISYERRKQTYTREMRKYSKMESTDILLNTTIRNVQNAVLT